MLATPAVRPSAVSAARGRRAALARPGLLAAAALSVGGGLVHLQVMPAHWSSWWGYGVFFLLTGVGQLMYAPALVRWPNPGLLWFGIAGNLTIVGTYLLSRTNGVPWGPHAGRAEDVGIGDFVTTVGEFVMVGMLVAALAPRTRRWFTTVAALAGAGLWVLRLTNNLL
jgi:hypothetical protein